MTEPEEIIESGLVALLASAVAGVPQPVGPQPGGPQFIAASSGIPVIGALTPAPDGVEKTTPDTCISVTADVASQLLDWEGPGVPFAYSVAVSVRVADGDDKTGAVFRDTCRAVRLALAALLGDGSAALSSDGFECDSFELGATATARDNSADAPASVKTYQATVTGRYIPPAPTTSD